MYLLEIFSNPKDLTEGIFGECLIWLLEVLNYLLKKNIIDYDTQIIFNINTLNYGSIFPKFINLKKKISKIRSKK